MVHLRVMEWCIHKLPIRQEEAASGVLLGVCRGPKHSLVDVELSLLVAALLFHPVQKLHPVSVDLGHVTQDVGCLG